MYITHTELPPSKRNQFICMNTTLSGRLWHITLLSCIDVYILLLLPRGWYIVINYCIEMHKS